MERGSRAEMFSLPTMRPEPAMSALPSASPWTPRVCSPRPEMDVYLHDALAGRLLSRGISDGIDIARGGSIRGVGEVLMSSTRFLRLLFALLAFAPCARLSAQERAPCPPPAAFIAPKDPAYADAMALKNNLESQGLVVSCVFETKFSSQFLRSENGVRRSTIEGEACIQTNLGALSVLFMLRPRTFDALKIEERHKGGRYLYSVSGMPDVWPRTFRTWSSVPRTYFFRHDNYMLTAAGDELRSAVEAALHQVPVSL